MNRRNFFKVVTGFVAGIFATSAKSEPEYSCSASMLGHPSATNTAEPDSECGWNKRSGTKYCGGKNGTLCPRCKFAANPPCVDDSKMIQEAIDLARDGGVVYFPKGTYNLRYGIMV